MKNIFKSILKSNKGATAVEYALIAAIVATVAIGGMTFLGGKMGNSLNKIGNQLTTQSASL